MRCLTDAAMSAQVDQQPESRKHFRESGSLGWITESSIQPRKKRVIEGVSKASLQGLEAQLYKEQEHAKLVREGLAAPRQRRPCTEAGRAGALLGKSNEGVEARDQRDRLALKTEADRLAESEAALDRKSVLYDRLKRGEVECFDDIYNVDFAQASVSPSEVGGDLYAGGPGSDPIDTAAAALGTSGGMLSTDMQRERQRRDWEEEETAAWAREEQEMLRREEHVENVEEIHREAEEAQDRLAEGEERRAHREERHLMKLRDDYIELVLAQKRAEKAARKAAKQQKATKHDTDSRVAPAPT